MAIEIKNNMVVHGCPSKYKKEELTDKNNLIKVCLKQVENGDLGLLIGLKELINFDLMYDRYSNESLKQKLVELKDIEFKSDVKYLTQLTKDVKQGYLVYLIYIQAYNLLKGIN